MTDVTITEFLPYVISVVTVGVTVLQGNLHRKAWLANMGCQALWLAWIIASRSWGFLPLNLVFWVLSVRNHMAWRDRE